MNQKNEWEFKLKRYDNELLVSQIQVMIYVMSTRGKQQNPVPWIQVDSCGFTWIHADSSGFTWIHEDSHGFKRIHVDSSGFIRIQTDSYEVWQNYSEFF